MIHFCKKQSLLNRVPCVHACQRGLRANVLAWQHAKSDWRANVPNGVPIFQLGLPNWQKVCQFFEHSCYKMLSEISILYCIKNYTFYLIP